MNTRLNHIEDWESLARNSKYSVALLAELCEVSPRTLERFFKKKMGKPPKMWLQESRLKQAKVLLTSGSSVKEVAADLGFRHGNHLSNQFKKITGFCPTELGLQIMNVKKCRVFG